MIFEKKYFFSNITRCVLREPAEGWGRRPSRPEQNYLSQSRQDNLERRMGVVLGGRCLSAGAAGRTEPFPHIIYGRRTASCWFTSTNIMVSILMVEYMFGSVVCQLTGQISSRLFNTRIVRNRQYKSRYPEKGGFQNSSQATETKRGIRNRTGLGGTTVWSRLVKLTQGLCLHSQVEQIYTGVFRQRALDGSG